MSDVHGSSQVVWAFLLISCIWGNYAAQAQPSITVGAGIGGHLGKEASLGHHLPFDEYVSAAMVSLGLMESLSPGLQTEMRLAYALSPYVQLEALIRYTPRFSRQATRWQDGQRLLATDIQFERLQVSPGLRIGLGNRRFSPYIRSELMLPGRYQIDLLLNETGLAGQEFQAIRLEAKAALGWSSSLGLAYRLTPWLSLYYELVYQHQAVRVRESTLLEYQIDGQDELNSLAPFQVQAFFQENWDRPINQPQQGHFNPQAPLELETLPQTMQALGLHLGLILLLGRKTY